MTQTVPGRSKEVVQVLPGLLLAMTLAMLDNMIVGTAMPRIVSELGGLEYFTWVTTSYVLGTTVSTPIWGKLGDLYGRKGVFLTSVLIFIVGSALCGMAGSDLLGGPEGGMAQLIAFRAVQGIGGGGLLVGVVAIIGDLVPPRQRGQYQGIMAGVMSLSMIAGPLVGGFITDNADWRWAFYINLPLGGASLIWCYLRLRLPKHRTDHRIDWPGAIVITIGITALVLIATWGGQEHGYPWGSWQILSLAALAVVSLAVFIPIERRAAEPILPLHVFADRNFTLMSVVGVFLGFALFGAIAFVPIYQQLVQGATATNSGLLLLPMMLSSTVVSVVVGLAVTKTGRYRRYPIIGGLVMMAGLWLLSLQDAATPKWQTGVFIAVLGAGIGFLMQTTVVIAQNSVDPKDMGVASSTATFFRSIGGSFGISIFGAIFNSRLTANLTERFGPQAAEMLGQSSTLHMRSASAGSIPAQVKAGFVESLADAIASVFAWSLLFAVVVPLASAFVKHVPLRTGLGHGGAAEPEKVTAAAE